MAESLNFEIISEDTIKPSIPTPTHVKTYRLSVLDQLAMSHHTSLLLCYPPGNVSDPTPPDVSRRLKTSLSETLSAYYPFAGRFSGDGLAVDCADQGVQYAEARIGCSLRDFLRDLGAEVQCLLFPRGYLWKLTTSKESLLGVQATFFDCGGVSVGVSLSHKVADGCTLSSFLTDWSSVARDHLPAPPSFLVESLESELPFAVPEIELVEKDKCITKRFIFDNSKIGALRDSLYGRPSLNPDYSKYPTRVEFVTALLYKCALASSISASREATPGKSLLIQLVNMRRRTTPPFPENTVGNFTWYITVSPASPTGLSLEKLVGQMKTGMKALCDGNMDVNEWLFRALHSAGDVKVLFDDLRVYRCSSFCRWPFYSVDFGFGKPAWVGMPDGVVKNVFVLFDTPDGDGIEAAVCLEEDHMGAFERNEELLAFASPAALSPPT